MANGRPGVLDAQGMLHHLQLGAILPGNGSQPTVIHGMLFNPRADALNLAHQGHGDLRAKARAQAQRIAHGVRPSARQAQIAQLGVGLEIAIDVGHRRHDAVLQRLDRQHVLDAHAHGVTGVALGVGDHHLVGRVAKGAAQGVNFRRRAAAARGRKGFV